MIRTPAQPGFFAPAYEIKFPFVVLYAVGEGQCPSPRLWLQNRIAEGNTRLFPYGKFQKWNRTINTNFCDKKSPAGRPGIFVGRIHYLRAPEI